MFQQILNNLLSWDVLLGLVIGIGAGMIIGIIPGLGGSIGCALLIPLSYAMKPVGAIAMMLALYTTSTYGGSFSAILLHTPGTAASAATSDDGYALTVKGRALEAIGWSTICSSIGGVFSGFVLLFVSPPLARMAVQFNDPEKFFIAVFGITIIGSLAGGNVIKGLISGLLGMMIGCVGMDDAMGALRYTFGNAKLSGGIDSMPVLIGLFSICQVMVMCEKRDRVNSRLVEGDIPPLSGQFLPPIKKVWKQKWNIVRSSIIGTLIGILPGAGANIGCWVSYNEAKRASKHPEEFGKGSIEGIVASEAANNAVTGGAFVPLLTLSVPGSPVAAVVLSALLLQGLQPGNKLFTTQGGITYSIIIAFILSNILMALFGAVAVRHMASIIKCPVSVLAPCITVMSVLGVYAMQLKMMNVLLLMIFGIVAYIMRKVDIPVAPMMLGLILGPMAEASYVRCITLAKNKGLGMIGYFATRPICVVLMGLIVLSLFAPAIGKVIGKAMERAANKNVGEQAE